MTSAEFLSRLFSAIEDDTEPFIDVARRAGLVDDLGDYVDFDDTEPSFKILVIDGLAPTLGVNPGYGVVLQKEACARARVVIGVTTTGRAAVIKDNVGGAKVAKWGDLR